MESAKFTRLKYRYHHVATSDGPKQLKEGSLFVFFAGDRLCYWSVPVKRLSYPSESSYLECDPEYVGFKAGVGTTPFFSKPWIYLMGRLDRVGDKADNTRSYLMKLELESGKLRGGLYPRSQMHSGKGLSSIVVQHSGVIYVLANDIFDPFRPAHTFEVYDPTSDTWYALKPPPFHYPGATYMTLSYVVMGNHICVSTEKENGAWAYLVDAGEWAPCSLFCDYYKPRKFSSDGTGKSFFQIRKKGGSPFPFTGQAILYRDVWLISLLHGEQLIVGYQIDSGKVVKKQTLCPLQATFDRLAILHSHSLMELGDGYFCCTYVKWLENDFSPKKLGIVIFKVELNRQATEKRESKRQRTEEELSCEVCSRNEIGVNWLNIGASVLSFVV